MVHERPRLTPYEENVRAQRNRALRSNGSGYDIVAGARILAQRIAARARKAA